ncbi:hypothetical protein E4U41_001073 [Claviceps citrina]|nr:hypothetical protein E4U41_001073 [Claviceps citrina]
MDSANRLPSPSPPPPLHDPDRSPPQEWHVVKPRNNHRRKQHPAPAPAPAPGPSSAATRTRTSPLLLPQDITAEYHRVRQDPPTQQCCHSVRLLLRANAASCARVDKAVCLGGGSFDPPDGGWEAKRRAYVQFVVFEEMVRELESLFNTSIHCTFQEPLLTAADTAFLTQRGHAVVPAPLASTAVTPHTLLFGIHLYRPLYQEALHEHLPSVFVGTGWETWEQLMLPGDYPNEIKTMHDQYRKWEFPQHGLVFSSTWLYWRGEGGPSRPGVDGLEAEC